MYARATDQSVVNNIAQVNIHNKA